MKTTKPPLTELRPLTNREGDKFTLPADGWFHLAPKGEFEHREGNVIQVVDDLAVKAMVNRFKEDAQKPNFAGLLVDYDHFSYDTTKSSEAAGWIMALQNREDGLWGKLKLTPDGEKNLLGGNYRFISPVWLPSQVEKLGNRRVRPLRLDTAGLTNSPNLKGMVPLSNRENDKGISADAVSAGNNKRKNEMKSVLALLGLSADASEEAALEAATKLKNRATEAENALTPLKNRVTELEGTNKHMLEAQVEADLEKYANRIAPEKKESWKKALLANRADAIELLDSLQEGPRKTQPVTTAQKPLHNRSSAKAPGSVTEQAANVDARRNVEVNAYMNRNKCDFESAWNAVRVEKPELFQDEGAEA